MPPPEPQSRHARLYATDACRARVRNRELAAALADVRARQRSLPLDPAPAGWTPAQREQSAHMRKRESRKTRMLARLMQGEATTWELMQLGGSGWRSRLQELREDGHNIPPPENRLDYAVYRLEPNP